MTLCQSRRNAFCLLHEIDKKKDSKIYLYEKISYESMKIRKYIFLSVLEGQTKVSIYPNLVIIQHFSSIKLNGRAKGYIIAKSGSKGQNHLKLKGREIIAETVQILTTSLPGQKLCPLRLSWTEKLQEFNIR
ncbi:unnamed protein product [Ilex paraguariensis]|uniref:Uncharacterized protein n=1 Tax=Ilex paraguariensis TaxID=185542 RepID=A0ABC8SZZ2_9AQUA